VVDRFELVAAQPLGQLAGIDAIALVRRGKLSDCNLVKKDHEPQGTPAEERIIYDATKFRTGKCKHETCDGFRLRTPGEEP
jgi:hypothetical protein